MSSAKNTPSQRGTIASTDTIVKPTISTEVKALKDKISDLEGRIATLEQLVLNFSSKLESFSEAQSQLKNKYEDVKVTSSMNAPYFVMSGSKGPEVNKGKTVSVADILASNRGVFN